MVFYDSSSFFLIFHRLPTYTCVQGSPLCTLVCIPVKSEGAPNSVPATLFCIGLLLFLSAILIRCFLICYFLFCSYLLSSIVMCCHLFMICCIVICCHLSVICHLPFFTRGLRLAIHPLPAAKNSCHPVLSRSISTLSKS